MDCLFRSLELSMIQNKNGKNKNSFQQIPKLGDGKLLAPERKSHLLLAAAAAAFTVLMIVFLLLLLLL